MNIIPKLNLNRVYQNNINASLVNARNVKLSEDNTIINDEELIDGKPFNSIISEYGQNVLIKGCIECNEELVFIVKLQNVDTYSIIRYNEKYNTSKVKVVDFDYRGGELKGTFTYNAYDELIVSIAEYNTEDKVPLKTINLGKWEDDTIIDNVNGFALSPEVYIPKVVNHEYYVNNIYKGIWYCFIRFKINNSEYTQWFDLNHYVIVDNFRDNEIMKYYAETAEKNAARESVTIDVYSDETDVSTNSFILYLSEIFKYDFYQLGFICVRKDYTKCFNSNDIKANVTSFKVEKTQLNEYSANDMITTYNNYYNVRNVLNYNNRLYISNYEEQISKDIDTSDIVLNINSTDVNLENYKKEKYLYLKIGYYIRTSDAVGATNIEKSYYGHVPTKHNETYVYPTEYYVKVNNLYSEYGGYPLDFEDNTLVTITDASYNNLYENIKGDQIILAFDAPNSDGKLYVVDETGFHEINEYTVYFKYNSTIPGSTANGVGFRRTLYSVGLLYSYELTSGDYLNLTQLINTNTLIPTNVYSFYIHYVDKYGQVSDGYKINPKDENITFVTDFGERYFTAANYINGVEDSNEDPGKYKLFGLNITINNIPDGYVGWFISYELVEQKDEISGIVCYNGGKYVTFYSEDLNIKDSVSLNFNSVILYKKVLEVSQNLANSTTYRDNSFKVSKWQNEYIRANVLDYKINAADSENNILASSSIDLNIDANINANEYHVAILYNDSNTKYTSLSKTLIPMTPVIYETGHFENIFQYDGFVNLHNVYLFNKEVFFNTGNNTYTFLNPPTNSTYVGELSFEVGTSDIANMLSTNNKFMDNIQYYYYSNVFNESKQIKNAPLTTMFVAKKDTDHPIYFAGKIVEAKQSIDLFENKFPTVYENYPKTLTNYRNDIKHLETFNKTIRRSNVIQDELGATAWRRFNTNEYKFIAENKGIITNIVILDNVFLIHTEHSLFILDANNVITANDKKVQTEFLDIFDIRYKEVFTSKLGYGGMQDNISYIIGQFGYIYFDKDANEIYRFDNKKLELISEDIELLLNKLNPNNITFTEDKESNRILFNINNIILSFNYKTGSYISFHDIDFNKAYHTKNKAYLIKDVSANNSIVQIYNRVPNYYHAVKDNSKIAIIINSNYEVIKSLEFIKYAIRKYPAHAEFTDEFYDSSPVEGCDVNYPCDSIRIYNDFMDTKQLELAVKTIVSGREDFVTLPKNSVLDFKTPYWHLGFWNFNMIHNNQGDYNANNIDYNNVANEVSRMQGNYFIIEFVINNNKNNNVKIEFENINLQLK